MLKDKMDIGENYQVKDLKLAEKGRKNIEWAEKEMRGLMKVREQFKKEKPFKGVKIGLALHVTKETAALVRTLKAGGAEIAITGCNPPSAQDDVCAALCEEGINIWAYKGETKEDYYKFIEEVISFEPNITIDDGCDLIYTIHTKYPELSEKIWGGCEETTTGIIRLRAMEKDNVLKYPVIAVNDSKTKYLMDNIKGTGQSTIDGLLRATNILLSGKTFVVCGYRNCGKGVAARAKGMDANVIVTEVDPFKALQAVMDGFKVMPMKEAAKIGDIFVTVTGNKGVIRKDHFDLMKDGAILANAGHFNVEIDIDALEKESVKKRKIREFLDEYTLKNGKRLYLAAEGRLVNLVAAEGHPSAIMSLSFMNQSFACEYIVKNRGKLKPKVYVLSEEIDMKVAKLHLEAIGIKIDVLEDFQKEYLSSWQEGT